MNIQTVTPKNHPRLSLLLNVENRGDYRRLKLFGLIGFYFTLVIFEKTVIFN